MCVGYVFLPAAGTWIVGAHPRRFSTNRYKRERPSNAGSRNSFQHSRGGRFGGYINLVTYFGAALRALYLNKLEDVLKRFRPKLATSDRLKFRNCFGAVAGYVDGNIFASCGKFGLALRLPSQTLAELFGEPDESPLKYFEKGHVKKDYAVIPERIIDDRARFRKLLNKSVKFALSVSLKE
jgi:TfoX/Sxy family transcriptional regulator of competence genes